MKLGTDPAKSFDRKKRRRKFRATAVAGLVAVLFLMVAGFVYTWYIGQKESVVVESASTEKTPKPRFTEPRKPTDRSQVGVAAQSFTSPVKAGSNSSLSVKTLPGAACSIMFTYNKGRTISKDTGLIPKVADEYGFLDWTWTVTADVREGTWPVEVTCAYNNKSAYYRADLVVEK